MASSWLCASRVTAITVVAGNVEVQQATRNRLYGPIRYTRARELIAHLFECKPGFTGATDWAIATIHRQNDPTEAMPPSKPLKQIQV